MFPVRSLFSQPEAGEAACAVSPAQPVEKASQSFAPAGAKEVGSVFCRGVYVAENTSRPVSVRMVRQRRTMRARNGLHPA